MENMVDAEAIRSAILLLSFNIVHWHYLGEIAHDSSMRPSFKLDRYDLWHRLVETTNHNHILQFRQINNNGLSSKIFEE